MLLLREVVVNAELDVVFESALLVVLAALFSVCDSELSPSKLSVVVAVFEGDVDAVANNAVLVIDDVTTAVSALIHGARTHWDAIALSTSFPFWFVGTNPSI